MARGESLAYDRLDFRLSVREAGREILRERASIVPAEGLGGPAVLSGHAHYGVFLAVGGHDGRLEGALREAAGSMEAGVTRLRGSGVLLKALAGDSRSLHALFVRAREAALPLLSGRPATALRRT